MEKTILTLCIIRHEGRILLGLNKGGLGIGKWSGAGGHVEQGETIDAAAQREVKEEFGVTVDDIEKAGILTFKSPKRALVEMHIYKATQFQGELIETEEMTPCWFTKDTLPFKEMWSSDLYWMPYFFKDRLFVGEFEYDAVDRVISHDVKMVDTPGEIELWALHT